MSELKTQNDAKKHKKRKMLLLVKNKHFVEAHNIPNNWRSVCSKARKQSTLLAEKRSLAELRVQQQEPQGLIPIRRNHSRNIEKNWNNMVDHETSKFRRSKFCCTQNCTQCRFVRTCLNLWETAWICENLPEFVRACLNLWEPAWIYESLPEFVRACLNLWEPAWIYESLPEFVRACLNLWEPAWFYESLPEFMKACLNLCRGDMEWGIVPCAEWRRLKDRVRRARGCSVVGCWVSDWTDVAQTVTGDRM